MSLDADTIPKSRLPAGAVVRQSLAQPFLVGVVLIGAPMSLVVGFGVWWSLVHAWFSITAVLGLVVLGAALTLGAIWMLAIAQSNFGIILDDDGVVYLDRTIKHGALSQQLARWNELHDPVATGRFWGMVSIGTSSAFPLWFSYSQARAVLSDRRCPLRGALPDELISKLDLQ